jgi:hypothetical protein
MPVWLLSLPVLYFWFSFIQALVTGRVPAAVLLFKITYADRRENPYFYWFFTGMLGVICLIATGWLAEAAVPGLKMPAPFQ